MLESESLSWFFRWHETKTETQGQLQLLTRSLVQNHRGATGRLRRAQPLLVMVVLSWDESQGGITTLEGNADP